jgi:hypothetical protein
MEVQRQIVSGVYRIMEIQNGTLRGKSSKLDLPINKSTYKYINLSYQVDYVLKKQKLQNNLTENNL